FQAEDGIRDLYVTGVQTCALPIFAQFYDDKPCPRCIFISNEIEERALLAEALGTKSGHKIEVSVPQRGEKKDLVDHALANARERSEERRVGKECRSRGAR